MVTGTRRPYHASVHFRKERSSPHDGVNRHAETFTGNTYRMDIGMSMSDSSDRHHGIPVQQQEAHVYI